MIHLETSLPYVGVMDSSIGGRADNQDSCGYSTTKNGLLLVVCDGLGGGPSGKLASTIATQEIIQFVNSADEHIMRRPVSELLTNAIQHANTAVYSYGLEHPETMGMGTTVVALLINKDCATIAHVGDSRCYQMRRGKIVFKTNDHSVVAELVRKGTLTEEQARISPNSNIITRVLGLKESVEVDVDVVPYEKHDRFYLCSDGVWGTMPEDKLSKQFYRFPNLVNILESTTMLVDEIGASEGGHHDNHTLIILETTISSKLKQKMSTKHKRIMQGLVTLLILSLIVNIITVFNRERAVSQKETIKELRTIVDSLVHENTFLKTKSDEININAAESELNISTDDVTDVNEMQHKTLKDNEISDDIKFSVGKVTLPEKLRDYLDIKSGKNNLIKDLDFLVSISNRNKKEQSRKNIIEQLNCLKKDFEKIDELSSYEQLLKLVKDYDKNKKKQVKKIIDNILSKYK